MQAMWSNTLDSDIVKGFVNIGTEIIQTIDKLGLLNSALLAFGSYKGFTAIFKSLKDSGMTIKSVVASVNSLTVGFKQNAVAQAAANGATAASTMANKLFRNSLVESLATQYLTTQSTQALEQAKYALKLAEMGLMNGIASTKDVQAAQAAVEAASIPVDITKIGTTELMGLAFKQLAISIWGAVKAIGAFLLTNPIGWLILAIGAIAGGIAAWNKWGDTVENLQERLSDLKSELSDIESDIDSLNSELKTTQERMAELIALPSLSFIEQEELATLKQTTAELERQLKLKEMLADSKEDKVVTATENYLNKVWNSKSPDKAYYVANDGAIKKDEGWGGFWNSGTDTKDILDAAIKGYDTARVGYDKFQTILSQWNDDDAEANKALLKQYGVVDYASKTFIEEQLERYDNLMTKNAEGINMIFADENFENLKYGMSEDIDTFLDEMYAYQLKWRQAQGEYVKSDAISSMFDATSTKEMQEFGKALQDIADSDLTDKEKNATILKQLDGIDGVLGDGVNKIDGKTDAYNRLHLAMETVGVTAQDIADYFVLEAGAFDSNSIQGIANQYQHMANVMDTLKNMSNNKFTFDGIEYNWDDFFSQDDQGKFNANVVKFSEILNGMDEKSRETFINIVESAANSAGELSKIDWNQAIAKLDFSGLDRTFELLNNEFEGLNNEMFAGAADDIHGLIDTVSELQAALEDVASTMDLVHTAQTQMTNSGRISTKTALELMQTTEDWESILEITNGTIKLRDGAEQHLIQTELTAIKTQLHYAWTSAQARYETALAAQGELDYANNSGIVMTAESIKAEAIGRVSAVVVALGAAMDELMAGNWGSVFSAFGDTYKTATATVVQDAQQYATDLATLKQNADKSKKIYDAFSSVDTVQEFKNNYDFDETPGDKYDEDAKSKAEEALDAFQKEMEYWENRIGASQSKYEQLQNEIDLLEKKGQKAGKDYYLAQGLIEEGRLELLEQQKEAAQSYLKTFDEGSEEWFRKKPAYWETNMRNPLDCWNLLRALYTTTQG